MKDLVNALMWLVVLVALIALISAIGGPAVSGLLQDLVTDKAELERAKGERAIMEASARAVDADRKQTVVMVAVVSLALIGNIVSTTFIAYLFATHDRPTPAQTTTKDERWKFEHLFEHLYERQLTDKERD